ncbi:hypothetical protein E4U26_006054 [Claviceps purpurea]|nr:hypothetical protein E4U11_000508 [Claviceps purpurea]KAG6174185.1 hypothetical protein E4U51_003050 [Claviceps purpurea]KAG6221383.1 hypothetical protein E4U26_006054 [Claviceps purpurea]
MKFNTLSLIICFLAVALGSLLVPSLRIPEPINHRIVPTWRVNINPDGPDLWEGTILVNGTIQQVDAYMDAHYPGWSAKMENFPSSHSAPAKRAPDWKNLKDFNCNRLLNRGSTCAIVDEIKYLRRISKDRHPRNGPGPRSADPVVGP